MAWVRIDEDFAQHPKVIAAGPLGMAMDVAAMCYCNKYLTDGFVPAAVVPTLLNLRGLAVPCEDIIAALLRSGLWHEVEGGYQIHDYLDYQPSKAEVLELREVRREVGRKGGLAKSKQTSSKLLSKTSSKNVAKVCPDPDPVSDPDLVIDQDTTTTKDLTAFIATHFGASPHIIERLTAFVDDGMHPSCVLRACEIAVEMDKRTVRYVESILNRWYEAGIRTRDQAQHSERQYRKQRESTRSPTTTSLPRFDPPEDQAKVEELQRELKSLAEGMKP
jgi:DnaD/phage-associated family protein